MDLEQKIGRLAEYMRASERIVFFGGAGVSTESGIPDFRSAAGIYAGGGYDEPPEVMLSRTYFFAHTDKFYEFYRGKMLHPDAKPNDAHKALADLERRGKLKAVITQNVDGLHSLAGSKSVIELHGSANRNLCMGCKKEFDARYIIDCAGVPLCDRCGGLIKPDVVLYEEQLDERRVMSAVEHISGADMLIVGGTSLVVYPAAHYISYFRGARGVIINKSGTPYDDMFELAVSEGGIGSVLSKACGRL